MTLRSPFPAGSTLSRCVDCEAIHEGLAARCHDCEIDRTLHQMAGTQTAYLNRWIIFDPTLEDEPCG